MKREPVRSEHDRDEWLRRLLRRRSAHGSAMPASDVCLDAETLAAWVDGGLNAKDRAIAENHASNCSRCMALLAAFARSEPEVPSHSAPRRALFKWLVPVAAAATAVAIWVAIPEQQRSPVEREAVSIAPPAAPVGIPPPAAAPQVQERPSEGLAQQAPSARVDQPSDVSSRNEARESKERAFAVDELVVTEKPAPLAETVTAPAPPPPASAESFKDSGAAAAGRTLSRSPIIQSAASDPAIRWRVVASASVERSTDGGNTWVKTSPPPDVAPNNTPAITIVGIRAIDALNATVTTSDGRTFSTANGGASWAAVQEKPAAPF